MNLRRKNSITTVVAAVSFMLLTIPLHAGMPVRTVALKGQQAPGLPAGAVFRDFTNSPKYMYMNAAGQVAFDADVAGGGAAYTNDEGVWSDVRGSLELVLREGNPAPGLPSGVLISTGFDDIMLVGIADNGELCIGVKLEGTGIVTEGATSNDTALYLGLPGDLRILAREGSPAPGLSTTHRLGDLFGSRPVQVLLTADGRATFKAPLLVNNHAHRAWL